MAEALLKLTVGTSIFVDSCGLRRVPLREEEGQEGPIPADPFVQTVMAELGCDLSLHRPKTFDDLEDTSFDLVISLTPEAQHRSVELARGRSADIEYWPTQDPTGAEGNREQKLQAYREVCDGLLLRIRKRFSKAAAASG